MSELCDLTAAQALRLMEQGQLSSLELTRACLERSARLEPSLHAYIAFTPESALAQAAQGDELWQAWRRDRTQPRPALLGLPTAVKDVLAVRDVPCTCGSRILEGFIPPFHATVVERLLAAGMVITGKTNCDEFAMGSSTENSAYGVTRNPWDLGRVPGGSSGGSAAAVAGRLVPAALGTDTGGSVRQPASFCGITGLKPTYGRVSRYGLVAYGSSLDSVGIFARDARDAALYFRQMAGYDPRDATSLDAPVPEIEFPPEPNLTGLRIGVPRQYFIPGIQPAVEQAVRAAIAKLEELGARAVEIDLPHTEYALPVYYLIAPAEASANLARYDGLRYGPREEAANLLGIYHRTRGARFGAEVKRRIMLGTYALSAGYYDAYYGQAQKVRTLIRQDFSLAFQQVDAIAAPVAPTTAFRLGQHTDDPLSMYLEDVFTLPANLVGVPGLAFPVGFDGEGLPIGMQLMGPPLSEPALLQMADAYQGVTGWHEKKPDL